MSTFKQKTLFAALAGMGALGVVDSAQAVHINQDGLGQALVYPYYTARSTATSTANIYTTALSVVNTTASAKAVKVRFLEGRNSREVLDFNLFLSQYDVWTAGIVPAGAGAGLFTTDNSCTSPTVSRSSTSPTLFRNAAYVGDGGGDTLDRTYEGYFEMLEMGSIIDGTTLQVTVTHKQDLSGPNASKPTCSTSIIPTGNVCTACALPSGGLMGTASLINVNEGTDFSYDAVALDGWSNQIQFTAPGTQFPTISNASPPTSVVIDNTSTGGRAVVTSWNNPRDAVSAIMMRNNVYNEYSVESLIKAATDWILTMPTKRFYITTTTRANPFENPFRTNIGSCDLINLTYYDREEQTPGAIVDFSPTTPDSRSICWEANVLTFTANEGSPTTSNVFNSKNYQSVPLKTPWINGWADLSFPVDSNGVIGAHTLPAPVGATTFIPITTPPIVPQTNLTVTYFGLPIVGFAVQSYSTTGLPGVNPNVLSNYGGNFMHKYLRSIK